MKRNIKISIIASLLFFTAAAIAFAATSTTQEKTVDTEKVSQESISKGLSILNLLGSNAETYKEKVVFDELQNKTIYEIENEKYFIDMDTDNNLVGIHSKKISTNLKTSNFDLNQAQVFIQNKYTELNLPEDYELNYIEKYDDLIWQANFEKKYGEIYNKYESVKVYFIPDSDEIIALGVFNEPATFSDISISEEEAIATATNYLNTSANEIVSAELTMEKSNSFYDKENKDTSIHPTWVIQMSNSSIVYVDAQSNSVIGGDRINE